MAEIVKTWKSGDTIVTLRGTTLYISGKGKMYDIDERSYYKQPSWGKENVLHAIIEDGVENIGSFAFYYCLGLKSIKIPESVKRIGAWAFEGCSALEDVILPNSIESIGYGAFGSCKSMKSITFPNHLKEISHEVFRYCEDLTTVINKSIVPQRISRATFLYTKRNVYNMKSNEDEKHLENLLFKRVILYVPKIALNAYRKADGWRLFEDILPLDETSDNLLPEDMDIQIEGLETKKANLEKEITDIEQQLGKLHFQKLLMRGLKGNPKHVAEFMSLFNQRDGLKYLTHDIDGSEDFDYEEVLSLVRKVCTENFEEKEIPSTLRELLNQFIFEENPQWKAFDKDYNELEMTSGWSSGDWAETKNSNLHPIRQPQFAEIIRNFKRLTRIESPYLETLVNKVFADDTFEINTKDLSKADFYTHVGEFKAALETIFAEIQKRADCDEKKTVSVEYKRETSDDFFVRKIIITHHNSFPTRDDKDALINEWLSFQKGCMAKIAAHLQGYCHWSVETRIDGEPVRVNILREQETEPYESIDGENVDGFTHILKFYYQ